MADDKKNNDPRTVQLKNVRLSFTDSLLEKKATVEDGTPKHSCNIIIESDTPEFAANKAKCVKALEAAGVQEWGEKRGPEMWVRISEDDPKRVCFRKGERFKSKETGEPYAGYAGNLAVACGGPGGGKRRPKMFDRYKRPVAEADILEVCYSGSYADVILSFYGTEKGGLGIFCSIEGIRSRQEGERMAGGIEVNEDMFDDLPDSDDAFEGTESASKKEDFDPLA